MRYIVTTYPETGRKAGFVPVSFVAIWALAGGCGGQGQVAPPQDAGPDGSPSPDGEPPGEDGSQLPFCPVDPVAPEGTDDLPRPTRDNMQTCVRHA